MGAFLIGTFKIGTGVVEEAGVFIAFANGMQVGVGTWPLGALNKGLGGSDLISFQLARPFKNRSLLAPFLERERGRGVQAGGDFLEN